MDKSNETITFEEEQQQQNEGDNVAKSDNDIIDAEGIPYDTDLDSADDIQFTNSKDDYDDNNSGFEYDDRQKCQESISWSGLREGLLECTNVIKLMYDHPWPSYKKIPTETRERCFQKWEDKSHNGMIKKIFDYRMTRRLQQMVEDVHESHNHLTIWLQPDIKKALYVHWETAEGFRHHRLTNRANRTSARSSKYTSRSGIFMKTKTKLFKLLDHDATLAETFKYTHTLKENKKRLADQQSTDH
ncbi:hypothetical protein Ahy_B01g052464 [Arachis hypogaea]|uniref:Protein FAR1-RELATED SEQUENCE n=1 Tax=Arachis hypogaea TaxID=3818 RepID=A0A445APK1_ARAHY|nr:hypothetical protein Ahy_B01g052464 [Arachis hypogaea]